jgi:hypothetical protein
MKSCHKVLFYCYYVNNRGRKKDCWIRAKEERYAFRSSLERDEEPRDVHCRSGGANIASVQSMRL